MEPQSTPSAYEQVVTLSRPTLVPATGSLAIVLFSIYIRNWASAKARAMYVQQLQNVVVFTSIGSLATSVYEWTKARNARKVTMAGR